MPLTPDQVDEVKKIVWTGLHSRDELVVIATEEIYSPDEIDAAAARQLIDTELAAKRRDEATWPTPTDCDRLASLFSKLNQSGLAAVINAGHTNEDGYEDVDELCAQRGGPGPTCFGYCFFHSQDVRDAQDGDGLHLAYGDFSGDEQKSLAVGRLIVTEARALGLPVQWNETFGSKILLAPFKWLNRGTLADTTRSKGPSKPWWKRLLGRS
jgi:hypothetical protein